MRRKHHEENEHQPTEQQADLSEVQQAVNSEELELKTVQLQEQLEATQRDLAETRDARLRLQAEFDNFRKRVRQEQLLDRQRGVEEFVIQLLPVLDNFERAIEASKKTQNFESMVEGVTGISRQLTDLLKRYEIEPINAVGQPFDPTYHDALQSVSNADVPENTVVAEAERGYLMSGRVIRPSKVLVAMGSSNGE